MAGAADSHPHEHRWDQMRADLLAAGALGVDELAELRRDQPGATRGALAREVAARQIFTITNDGRTRIPRFQLTEAGTPRPELAPLLHVLLAHGFGRWQLWVWLTSPTAYLSGDVPHLVATTEPQRALNAAEHFGQTSGDRPIAGIAPEFPINAPR